MRKFRVSFMLIETPGEVAAEYIIEAEWEEDAISQAHERWVSEFPEESKKPFSHSSSDA